MYTYHKERKKNKRQTKKSNSRRSFYNRQSMHTGPAKHFEPVNRERALKAQAIF